MSLKLAGLQLAMNFANKRHAKFNGLPTVTAVDKIMKEVK